MTHNDKINVEVEPTLFDGVEPQETAENTQGTAERETPEWLAKRVEEIGKRAAANEGVWQVIPTPALILRGETYYNQREKSIRELLEQSGMTADAVNTVLADYVGVLNGIFAFEATPTQMEQALKAVKPYVAFNIDRYGLYYGLLLKYWRFLLRLYHYTERVKSQDATEETKREYIETGFNAIDAMAVKWLLAIGYVEPSDFAGIDPSEMRTFFSRINGFAQLGEYTTYYTIARLALVATPDEMADVEAPPYLNTETPITEFCEQVIQEADKHLNEQAEKFAAAAANTEQEQEQARQAGKSWQDGTNKQTIVIYENVAKVLAKPINVSPYKAEIVTTLPIKRYIKDFNEHPVRFGKIETYPTITEQSVIRAFDGVGLLPNYLRGKMIADGDGRRLEFRTNLSEFAEICGYQDAGQAEKLALLGGLLVLRNNYIIVDKPFRYYEYKDMKGRTRRKRSGGLTAFQLLNIPQIGLDTGELIIEAYIDFFNSSLRKGPDGKLIPNNTFIDQDTYNKLRGKVKGTAQYRFNIQIATKSHKNERQLIYEVFGLDDMLKQAEKTDIEAGNNTEQKRVKTYIQNHYAGFKKKIAGWFDEYLKDGIITEFKREPSKTDNKDFVLSWKCPDPQGLIPPQLVQVEREPDEQ